MSSEQAFDYIVIGAGSSGCVVANRLATSGAGSVLLIEAGGPDDNPDIHNPEAVLKLWGSDIDWKYVTEPQPGLNGRQLMISRGKVLGGCSSIYAMVYVRGNRRDFDHWNSLGNEGWSYDDVLPHFKKSETFYGQPSDYHGTAGPLAVSPNPRPTPVAYAFAEAAAELGYGGPNWDFNGVQHENGGGLYQFNITPEGQRCSAAVAFLKPILGHPHFTVFTHTQVTRLLIAAGRVVGVEYQKDGQLQQVMVNREVILSAGAFDTPKLLLLSGIGPATELQALGIPVNADLPGVGQNLQDHLLLPVIYKSKQPLPTPFFIAESGLFVRTRAGLNSASPDLQYHFSAGIPAFVPPQLGEIGSTFFFVPILAQPQSRGYVKLRSTNPGDPPIINPRYFQSEIDITVHLRGIELSRELVNTAAFAPFNDGELVPGLQTSIADQKQFIRNAASTVWHPVGTAKMGRDALAVVDPHLKVHGIEGLRVADASIMPKITSGNTHAACVMIGEKAAAMILNIPT